VEDRDRGGSGWYTPTPRVGAMAWLPKDSQGVDSKGLNVGAADDVLLAVEEGDDDSARKADTVTRAEGSVTVAYPTIGEAPYRPPEPASVVCRGRVRPAIGRPATGPGTDFPLRGALPDRDRAGPAGRWAGAITVTIRLLAEPRFLTGVEGATCTKGRHFLVIRPCRWPPSPLLL